MASPNLSEIVTTTLRNRSAEIADNVSDNNPLLMRLKQRGKQKPVSGGRTIVEPIEYAENSTFKRYSGYETLDISPSDVLTAAEYEFKQAAVAVSISGLEMLQNSGKEAILDLLESRVENAIRTMTNNIGSDIYSDGTADGGKQIGGLQLLVADVPTSGTVGGIDRGTYTFWRNQATVSGTAASSSNIKSRMNALYNSMVRNSESPDLLVADTNYYTFYEESLQDIQRITSDTMANSGFQSLKYKTADVVNGGGFGGGCPTNHMYFLNTEYLKWRPHTDRNMVPLENADRFAVNQDAMVKLIGFAGNLTTSNASLQGVLTQS